jgi:hypothetical protein
MSEYKDGDAVAVRAAYSGKAIDHSLPEEKGIDEPWMHDHEIDINLVAEWAWLDDDRLAEYVRPWPDAERMALLEAVLLAARADLTYGTPAGTHTRELLAKAVAAVDAAAP